MSNNINSVCIKYNGETLYVTGINSGMNLNEVLVKIEETLNTYFEANNISTLDLKFLELDPLEFTRIQLDQAVIDALDAIKQTLEDHVLIFAQIPNLVLGTAIDINLRSLLGVNNDCMPTETVTLRQLLSLLVTEVHALKKKDYTENTCDENCGIVLTASGAFVKCEATIDAEGDFNSIDFLDIDNYAAYQEPT